MKYVLLFTLFAFLLPSLYSYSSPINRSNEADINFILLHEWQVMEGSNVRYPADFKNKSARKWIKTDSPGDIYKKCKGKTIWIRTELPSRKWAHPSVYIGQVDYFMQVFLDEALIYETGNEYTDSFLGRNQNLILLPDYKNGDELFIRIRTGEYSQTFNRKILLGSSAEIIKEIFLSEIIDLIFGVMFFAAGIILLIFILFIRQMPSLPGVALYLLTLGVFILSNSPFFQLMLNVPHVFYHLSFISIIFSPAPILFIIEKISSFKYKKIINIFLKILLMFLIFSIIIINTTSITFIELMEGYLFLILINILVCSIILFKSKNESKYEIKILMIGIAGFFFFIVIQVCLYIINDLNSNFGNNLTFLYLGVLILIVSMVWIAVDNYIKTNNQKETIRARELETIKHENEVRRFFAASLMESQENERNRIALELHDGVGQKLLLIKNHLVNKIKNSEIESSGKSLTSISSLVGELIQEIRAIIYNLRPQHLDQLGLKTAIETMIEKVSESADIKLHVNIDEIDELLPKGDEISFYRIVQECLNNIVKHSRAADAYINIKKEKDSMIFEISDNGVGFIPDSSSANFGLGLTGIRERSLLMGAVLCISSSPGLGTTIRLEYKFNKYP